jgi:hypothetical protein
MRAYQDSRSSYNGNRASAGGPNLADVARASGIADCRMIEAPEEVERLGQRVTTVGAGPTVTAVTIDGEDLPRELPSRDAVCLKTRLRSALG